MTALAWASVALGAVAYLCFGIFIGCCLKSDDRSGTGGLAAGFGTFCAISAGVFWYIAERV